MRVSIISFLFNPIPNTAGPWRCFILLLQTWWSYWLSQERTEGAFKLTAALFLRFCSLPFLADYRRFLNSCLGSNLSCCVSWPLLRLKSFCWLWKRRLKSQKGTGHSPSREQSVEVGMNRKVVLAGKWTMAKHENMVWCTFSVVPCPLAVCSFSSLCCLLHSANTSTCMAAWWVRSSWTDPAKK